MLNILRENLLRVQFKEGEEKLSLPAVLAGLATDGIAGFPALRAHQRHAWHAFLCQLGAMAMHKAALATLPTEEITWRDLLLALTPDGAGETAWCLVAPPDRPAFLQPPIPDNLEALKRTIATPDGIDMLVASRNHDLKQASMGQVEPDDWLFALLTLQTMQGYYGRYYGISRMNGGSANRAAVGVAPPGGPGAHFRRDVLRLLAIRPQVASAGQTLASGGIGLVWLQSWDGKQTLSPSALDPFYIEICRRIRLVETAGALMAKTAITTSARIEKTPGGVTGDPWAPVKCDQDGNLKVMTLDGSGFTYRRMVDLMFGQNGFTPAPLQEVADTDAIEGLVLIARALVRGEGETQGYHERIVPLSRKLRGLRSIATDPVSHLATERVQMAGEVQRRVLKSALLSLFQNGPETIDYKHDASTRKAEPFLAEFDRMVDRHFFEQLWLEAEAETEDAKRAARTTWLQSLLKYAADIVRRVDTAAPRSSHRHFRALSRALDTLSAAPWRNETLKGWMPKSAYWRTRMAPELPDVISQIVNKIAALLRADYFGNGPRAALRRMDPTNLAEPALQRLLADCVPDNRLGERGMADWGLIVHTLALGSPNNLLGAKSFGASLAQAQYSESRLGRLLQVRRSQLNDALPHACRFLVAKGESINPLGIARFVLVVSSASHADAARTQIARDFYRASRQAAANRTKIELQ